MQKFKGFQKPKRLECELETLTSTYGKFFAEPLERGFGLTLGNSLRRVLLSSIEGAAVTSVRVAGVLHEFSTIPGAKEDVTDVILNLKQLRLKLASDQTKTLTIQPPVLLALLGISMFIGIASSIVPAWNASRTNIIDALRFTD